MSRAFGLLLFSSALGTMDIFECIQAQDSHAVQALLHQDPAKALVRNADQCTPLMFSAQIGALDCLHVLLPYTPKMSTHNADHSALVLAILSDHWQCVEALVGSGLCDVDARRPDRAGLTPLMLAVCASDLRCVQALISVSDANQTNEFGLTSLMLAVRNQSLDCVLELLPVSDARAHSTTGLTALMIAAVIGDAQMVAILRPHSHLQHQDHLGRTALMLAAQHGRLKVLSPLHARDSTPWPDDSRDALGWACLMGRTACARWLLAHTHPSPHHRCAAFSLAVQERKWACVDLLALHVPESLALETYLLAPKHALPSVQALIEHRALQQALTEASGCTDVQTITHAHAHGHTTHECSVAAAPAKEMAPDPDGASGASEASDPEAMGLGSPLNEASSAAHLRPVAFPISASKKTAVRL